MQSPNPSKEPSNTEPISQSRKAANSQGVPPKSERRETHHCKPDQTSLLKSFIEAATFLIAGTGLVVFWGQWNAAKNANDMNATNFKLGERAWVGVDGFGISDLKVGSKPRVTVAIKNFGQTTALSAKYAMYPTAVINSGYPGYPSAIPPEVITAIRPLQASLDLGWEEHTIPPGKVQEQIREISPPMTQEQYDMLVRRQAWLVAYGRVQYMDIFKQPHTTWFCSYLELGSGPSSFAECGSLSDMK